MRNYDAWFPRYALRNRLMFFCRLSRLPWEKEVSHCRLFLPDISIKLNKLHFQRCRKNFSNDFALFPLTLCVRQARKVDRKTSAYF